MEDESGREAEIMDITASHKEGAIPGANWASCSILHFQTTTPKQRLWARGVEMLGPWYFGH